MRTVTLCLMALALGGCAAQYTPRKLLDDHPASAAAPLTAAHQHSRTLDLSSVDPVAPPSATPPVPDGPTGGHGDHGALQKDATSALFTCPMHPEVVSQEPGRCPKCRMKLVPKASQEERP
jgi:hypothetical protein